MGRVTRVFVSRLTAPLIFLTVTLILRINFVRALLFPHESIHHYLDAALVFLAVFLVIRLLDALWLGWYARRGKPFSVPKVLHTILLFILYVTAFFLVLKWILNISITPFLATSALFTAILGLAFQGVLNNLLSGLSLHFTRSFSKGDWIGLNSIEGIVIDTNWRETRLFDRSSNIVVISPVSLSII